MLPQFSRAGNFEPKLYTGGGMRFYLPLLHDIVAAEKPAFAIRITAQTGRFIRAVLLLPFRPGGKMKPQ